MDHLLRDSSPLELYGWLDDDAELPGWNILVGNPFAETLCQDRLTTVQNYFAEYHLEYFRQRLSELGRDGCRYFLHRATALLRQLS